MLNIDWATIAFQIINFLVLAVGLYYLALRPTMERVRKRRAEKQEMMRQAREEREEAEALRKRLEARLSRAEEEADEIITEAQKRAETERQRMLEDIEADIEEMLLHARADVEQIRRQVVDEFHQGLIDTICDIAAEMIKKAAPAEVHDGMIKQLTERIWEMGREEMERVQGFRRSLGERTPTAHVATARRLSSEQQGELARTLTALADRHVEIEMKVQPELAAGMRVRLGDIVVDNSIAGRLDELRTQASEALEERLADERSET